MKTILKDAESKMQKALDRLDYEYSTIRAGRANPAVLEKVSVDYYGAMTPVNQMAAISVAEARILVIQPWDVSTLKAIEKAILNSDIGITPTNDGKVLRLVFPQLTEERRKDLCKSIKKYGEECKVAVRNVRREAMDKMKAKKKDGELTEDDMKSGEKDVQKLTDKYCDKVDQHVSDKEKEIMSIQRQKEVRQNGITVSKKSGIDRYFARAGAAAETHWIYYGWKRPLGNQTGYAKKVRASGRCKNLPRPDSLLPFDWNSEYFFLCIFNRKLEASKRRSRCNHGFALAVLE